MILADYIKIHICPTGRRLFAHSQIVPLAREHGLRVLSTHLDRAIRHDRETLQVELAHKRTPQSRFSPEAGRLDVLVDRAVSGLDGFFESMIRLYGEDSELGRAALEIRTTVFPNGVADITRLPYVQEDQAVAAILERLGQPDMKALLARLPGVDGMIEQVRLRHAEYHAALRKEHEGPTRDDVRAMQMQGQDYLYGTVTLILAHLVEHGNRDLARTLLEPVERQIEDIRAARRRRRAPADVNPDTGEETPDSDVLIPE